MLVLYKVIFLSTENVSARRKAIPQRRSIRSRNILAELCERSLVEPGEDWES